MAKGIYTIEIVGDMSEQDLQDVESLSGEDFEKELILLKPVVSDLYGIPIELIRNIGFKIEGDETE